MILGDLTSLVDLGVFSLLYDHLYSSLHNICQNSELIVGLRGLGGFGRALDVSDI